MTPLVRAWLTGPTYEVLVEPFCGGGSVGLCAAIEGLVTKVVMVEIDPDVAAVWKVLAGVGAEQLAAKILEFPVTRETVADAVRREPRDLVEHAFQTILRNRTQGGGVMARRAGLINRGERNRGVSSRGYPATLAQRIRTIDRIRGRITFIEGDGLAETARRLGRKDTDIFLDPPYVSGEAAGRRLYTHHDVDPNQVLRSQPKRKARRR